MTKKYCDICKKEADEQRELVIGSRWELFSGMKSDYSVRDICNQCMTMIIDFIESLKRP